MYGVTLHQTRSCSFNSVCSPNALCYETPANRLAHVVVARIVAKLPRAISRAANTVLL
jgi:hypothetical protein